MWAEQVQLCVLFTPLTVNVANESIFSENEEDILKMTRDLNENFAI